MAGLGAKRPTKRFLLLGKTVCTTHLVRLQTRYIASAGIDSFDHVKVLHRGA